MTYLTLEHIERMKKEIMESWDYYLDRKMNMFQTYSKIYRVKLDCIREYGEEGLDYLEKEQDGLLTNKNSTK